MASSNTFGKMSEESNLVPAGKNFPTKEDLTQRFEEAKKKNQEIYEQALKKIKTKREEISSKFAEID
jgi:hypothetical protein